MTKDVIRVLLYNPQLTKDFNDRASCRGLESALEYFLFDLAIACTVSDPREGCEICRVDCLLSQ